MGMDIQSKETTAEEMADEMLAQKRCCFFFHYIRSDEKPNSNSGGFASWWERIWNPDQEKGLCWNAVSKIREWSMEEFIPRWKNFINRFKKKIDKQGCGGVECVGGGEGSNSRGRFQYDPFSYALNFDEGPAAQRDYPDTDCLHRDFSSRYATIPISVKSSMDLGRDGPAFSR